MNKMPFLQTSDKDKQVQTNNRLTKGCVFAFLLATHLLIGTTAHAQARFDVGLVNLVLPIPFVAGTYPISVTLYNASDTTTLRTARITWSVNGVVQPELNWSGALLPQKDTSLLLGPATFVFDPDNTVQVAILEANGLSDDDNANDNINRSGIRASYAGILQVGGLNPNFATVGELASSLSARGVAGPLDVRIRPGRYEEVVAFIDIPYCTPQRPITFQRDPSFSGTVTLASPQAAAAWAFSSGVLNLFFKNLHFESGPQSQQYGLYALMFSDKSFGVDTLGFSLDSCMFVGTAPAGESNIGLYLNTIGGIDRVSVQHCHFENLNEPAWLKAADGTLHFDDNEGENCGAPTIVFIRGNATLSHNVFSAAPDNPKARPLVVSLQEVDAVFEANQIRASGNQIATFAATTQQNGERLRIYNNFFHNESGLKGVGVNLEGSGIHFDFNSIRSQTGLALETNLSGPFSIRNNIISETHATGTAFRVNQTPYYPIDYNCYHATSGKLFNFAGTPVNTLAQWQTLLHRDSNSLAVDPGFYLAGSFQVKRAALDGAAVPIAGIATDLEGKPRDPQKSDIGASEFDPYPLDAAVLAVTAPVFPFGRGLQAIRVRLLNDATAPLQSIHFQVRVNGVALPDYEWTGLLAPDSTVEVSVGTFDFADFTPYILEVTAQSANGVPEFYVQNDTIRSTPLFTALSGVYEVGAGQTLTSPQAAAGALATYGVFSPVRFRLASGNYEGGLVLDSLTGNQTTVVFESASGQADDVHYRISGDIGIWLRGADNIAFLRIAFENRSKTATACIRLTGDVQGLTVDSCFFDLGFADAANQRAALVANNPQFSQPPAWLIDGVSIRNSLFKGGVSGIVLNPRYVKNLLVEDNRFEEQSQLGIQMAGYQVPGSAQCRIQHNVFESSDSARHYNGVSVFISVGVYSIDSTLAGTEVSRNSIRHDRGTAIAVVPPIAGAFIAYTNTAIVNNFIFTDPIDKGSGGPLVGSMGLGGRKLKVFYNTVRTTSERPCIFFSDMEQVEVRNNLFARENPQGPMFQSVNPGALRADYNNYYTPGLVLFDIRPFLGFYANWDYWQGIFQQDKHSLRVNPKFTVPGDYHIEQDSLNGKALPLPGVAVDLDGDARNPQTPDIGADEFKPFVFDVAMLRFVSPAAPVTAGQHPIKIRLRNRGLVALSGATIEWSVNGTLQTPLEWAGSVQQGQTADIELGSWLIEENKDYTFQAILTSANGGVDEILLNNTVRLEHLMTPLKGIYTVGNSSDDFPDFRSAVEALHRRGVEALVTFTVSPGVYPIALRLGLVPGTSTDNPVRFESGEDGPAFFKFKENQPIVVLDNAQFVTFSKLQFLETNPHTAPMVLLKGNCQALGFEDCSFRSEVQMPSQSQTIGIRAEPAFDTLSQLRVVDCQFQSLLSGIVLEGAVLPALDFQRNVLANCNQFGIYVGSPRMSGRVLSNQISRVPAFGLPSVLMRLSSFEASGLRVESNVLTGTSGYGLQLNLSSTGAESQVVNNFVDLQSDGVSDALEIAFSGNLLVAYNTVRITANQSAGHRLLFVRDLNGPIRLLNNVFDNRSWGYACASEDPSGFLLSKHNCWYSQNATPFYRNGQSFVNLADYRLTGLDGQSVFHAPFFPTVGDYHTADAALNGRAQPLQEVPNDLEGEKRHATSPDIGADESVLVGLTSVTDAAASIAPTLVHSSISVKTLGTALESVAVFDIRGRAVWQQGRLQADQCQIDASGWLPGVYVVRVQLVGGRVATGKVVRASR